MSLSVVGKGNSRSVRTSKPSVKFIASTSNEKQQVDTRLLCVYDKKSI